MKFRTVNEIDKFGYKDSYVIESAFTDDKVSFVVGALIVKANNSQNSNFTDSYASDATVTFEKATINKLVQCGYRRFDANDVLLEEIPDKDIPFAALDMPKLFNGSYFTKIECISEGMYVISIECAGDDPYVIDDEYELTLECGDVVIEWDKYLNRVQDV